MKSSPSRMAPGFTLIEVVIGLSLMATVVVASLLAFSGHQEQIRQANAKLADVDIADDLLNRLSATRDGIPMSGSGRIANHPNWYWQTRVAGEVVCAQVPLRIINLQIIEREPNSKLNLLVSTSLVEVIDL